MGVCMCGFCNVWVCVCVGVFINMCNCIYCVLYCCTVFIMFFIVHLLLLLV